MVRHNTGRYELQVTALRSLCLQQLQGSIAVDNVLDYVTVADACSEGVLVDACLEYIMQPENR